MSNSQGGVNIARAILAVYSKVGYVLKSGFNDHQKYKFAGESDFIEALRPAMIEAGLISYPTGIRGECKNIVIDGKPKNHATYIYTFRIIHAESGEYIDVEAAGEGTGNDDKSSYKAATGAQKYALRQMFLIETGNDPDKDPVTAREEEERRRKEQEAAAAREKAEAEKKKEMEKSFVPIPEESDVTGTRDWSGYTLATIGLIKGTKNFTEFNIVRVANKEGLEFLSTADEKLRAEITEISKQKAASFKAPEQPPVN